jgi:DNA end-binding protein Ku
MAPRSIWNGYTTRESKGVHCNDVHANDGARIGHRRLRPKKDGEVPYDEVVRGSEVEPRDVLDEA